MTTKVLKICYHGTTRENAEKIAEEGFNQYTFFARNLQDAIGYGGLYIFLVAFRASEIPDDWQFISREHIGPERIVCLKLYQVQTLKENEELADKVFESNIKLYEKSV